MSNPNVDFQVELADEEIKKSVKLRVCLVNMEEVTDEESLKCMDGLLTYASTLNQFKENSLAARMLERVLFEIEQLERVTLEAKEKERDLVALA